jgi:hypothetical protein
MATKAFFYNYYSAYLRIRDTIFDKRNTCLVFLPFFIPNQNPFELLKFKKLDQPDDFFFSQIFCDGLILLKLIIFLKIIILHFEKDQT